MKYSQCWLAANINPNYKHLIIRTHCKSMLLHGAKKYLARLVKWTSWKSDEFKSLNYYGLFWEFVEHMCRFRHWADSTFFFHSKFLISVRVRMSSCMDFKLQNRCQIFVACVFGMEWNERWLWISIKARYLRSNELSIVKYLHGQILLLTFSIGFIKPNVRCQQCQTKYH